MFEQFNLLLFSSLNSEAGLAGWRLVGAVMIAEWLIVLVPLGLAMLWISAAGAGRHAAVRAGLAMVCALTLNFAIGLVWFHPRPFMAGVGHTFMHHAPDSSFPSDHATIMLTAALVLAASRAPAARRLGTVLLPIAAAVAWSRVFLGVHYPLDMLGALVVSICMTLLANTAPASKLCASLVSVMETVYRRVLATPIARGWLRP